jgi:hypothetical protein
MHRSVVGDAVRVARGVRRGAWEDRGVPDGWPQGRGALGALTLPILTRLPSSRRPSGLATPRRCARPPVALNRWTLAFP